MIFVLQAEIQLSERNPACFAAPPHVDDLLAIRQKRLEFGAGLRGGPDLQPPHECKGTGLDTNRRQGNLLVGSVGADASRTLCRKITIQCLIDGVADRLHNSFPHGNTVSSLSEIAATAAQLADSHAAGRNSMWNSRPMAL